MTLTNTPLPTPEPAQTVQPACFTMLPALPDIESVHGKILFLENGNYKKEEDMHYLASLYDLTTRQSKPLNPEKVSNIAASPDGQTYATLDTTAKIVRFFSANGQLLKTLPPAEYMYGLDHWLNNEQIALNLFQPWGEGQDRYPIDQMIYNPFTGEREQFTSEQYPDIDRANARMYWEGASTTKYDPSVTRVVYPARIAKDYSGKSGHGYVLWDLENQIKLAEIVTGQFASTPMWAPDGSRFVINDDWGDGEFYAITRDGQVTQLTHLNSESSSAGQQFFSDLYSWSPDGRYLAFWRVEDKNPLFPGTLALLDTETGNITDTCISAGLMELDTPRNYFHLSPIWSPDGKYLVTEANRQEDGSYQSVLVDLEGNLAIPLGENIFPVGWLAGGDQ
jgi:hypothetical protein